MVDKGPYLLIAYVASAFVVAFLFFPVLIKLLSEWKIFDAPGKHKIHKHYVPAMGGICIVLGAGFSLLIGLKIADWVTYKYFFIATALMFITGLRDDILTLTPGEKLVGQVLPVIILVVFGDALLLSFYGMFFYGIEFPMTVSWLVTVFTIVILTNSYNLIDGIDGLAAVVAVLALTSFGIWFYIAGEPILALVALSFTGSTLAFLFFNWQPSRIFMGDTGALTIGLALSFFAVKFININYALPGESPVRFESSIGTAICILIIPIFDTLRVIIIRLSRLQSPFKADQNHLHHELLALGLSHGRAVMVLGAINLLFLFLAVILRNEGDAVILPIALVTCALISLVVAAAKKKYALHAGQSSILKE
jgi:UDP-GlcNAc:undecaprenyl-phosphate GlcNAc-1-phosphate transferase